MGSCLENWEGCCDDRVLGKQAIQEVAPSDDETGRDWTKHDNIHRSCYPSLEQSTSSVSPVVEPV